MPTMKETAVAISIGEYVWISVLLTESVNKVESPVNSSTTLPVIRQTTANEPGI